MATEYESTKKSIQCQVVMIFFVDFFFFCDIKKKHSITNSLFWKNSKKQKNCQNFSQLLTIWKIFNIYTFKFWVLSNFVKQNHAILSIEKHHKIEKRKKEKKINR